MCLIFYGRFRDVDVSNGREEYAVSWFNAVDDEEFPSNDFVYVKSNVDLWRLPCSKAHENLVSSKASPGTKAVTFKSTRSCTPRSPIIGQCP